jgi:hypothetical protein
MDLRFVRVRGKFPLRDGGKALGRGGRAVSFSDFTTNLDKTAGESGFEFL